MALMQPQQLPSDLGSIEPDVGPTPPQGDGTIPAGQPTNNPGSGEPDTGPEQTDPTPEEIKAHLDSLPDEDKAFLAEHLTPEFVRAISLISGPAVGQYLNQYADQDKVLVPVPRKVAEEHMKQQQGAQAQPAPQAPAQGGMMSPSIDNSALNARYEQTKQDETRFRQNQNIQAMSPEERVKFQNTFGQ